MKKLEWGKTEPDALCVDGIVVKRPRLGQYVFTKEELEIVIRRLEGNGNDNPE
ncbi:MAG TPA: hypothetical protein VFV82_04965 [Candidatus Binatia bacterium]|nr:hypothetical protein [Candidatus Binatia bacterium]